MFDFDFDIENIPYIQALGIILIASLVGLIILGTILLIGFKISKGREKLPKISTKEDSYTIQQIYQALTKMETRIEALETILFAKPNNEEKDKYDS